VLHKPADFQPGKRCPLLVVIHGGPSSYARPSPVDEWGSDTPYPIELWLRRGALVLEPNYRGSLGYGERFKSLILGKLGQGEPADVLAGVDALAAKGLVDAERVGVMGWSYGGYLTALLSVQAPQRFRAASVGAGITNWVTDYTNTDLYRALQDLKVPSQMIFYKGMGHVLTKPRMMRAAMQHNVDWFDRYLLGPEAGSAAGR